MYERSSRSPKSFTNSSRSACVRAAQCRPSERLAVSPKSKISLAILRTATRRSLALPSALPSFFSSGSSRALSTRSTCSRSWSSGAPARAGPAASASPATATASPSATRRRGDVIDDLLHLPEDVLREELFEVYRSFDLPDATIRRDELVGAPRADAHELLADQALRLDGRDRVLLQLHVLLEAKDHAGLIIGQPDRLHPADLHSGDLDAGPGLEAAYRWKIHGDLVARAPEERNSTEFNRKVAQCQDAQDQKHTHGEVDPSLHRGPLSPGNATARCRVHPG